MSINVHCYNEGPALVFFHGWGFDHSVWHSLVPLLPFTCFLVDLPGFGTSAQMDWSTFKIHLLSLLPQRFSIVGWSLGGLYATRLALEAGERVQHLVNVASSPYFLQSAHWPGIEERLLESMMARLNENAEQTFQEFLSLQGASPQAMPQETPSVLALQQGLEHLQSWDLRTHLTQLAMPVHYIFGRLDRIVPFKLVDLMQQQYPQFIYHRFKRAAHMPFISDLEAFLAVLELLRERNLS